MVYREQPETKGKKELRLREEAGIYIHIPFCKRFCYYCNFTKLKFAEGVEKIYTDYLLKELSLKDNHSYSISSIYFGGGSPSLFNPSVISTILEFIGKKFHIEDSCEISIEMNPEDVSEEKLAGYKSNGINRLSLGIQSFKEKDLLFLERNHSPALSKLAIESAIKAGFANINLDFIIGLPDQDRENLNDNFRTASEYNITHISAYILEGVKEKREGIPNEEEQIRSYNMTIGILNSFGFEQYEVSNFCRNNLRSEHNMKYWTGKSYIGAGISSSGFERGSDYRNYSDIESYFSMLDSGKLPIEKMEKIDPLKRKIATGLRLTEGIEAKAFENRKEETDLLISEKVLKKNRGNISVSPDKLSVLNEVLLRLI